MIDVYAIRLQNLFELVDKGLSGGFNSQQLIDFVDIVGNSTFAVQIRMAETSLKIGALSFEHNLILCFSVNFGFFGYTAIKYCLFGYLDSFDSFNSRYKQLLDLSLRAVQVFENGDLLITTNSQ
jgi:hypothetical protein